MQLSRLGEVAEEVSRVDLGVVEVACLSAAEQPMVTESALKQI